MAAYGEETVKSGLITHLPRLKRFAEVLVGDREEGTALLSRSLREMLEGAHAYQRGAPLDRWAFEMIYRLWLKELRAHADPMRRASRPDRDFEALIAEDHGASPDPLTVSFVANLPPQQRATLLLIFGEGFSYEDASLVLDCPMESIETRLIRASATLADKIGASGGAPRSAAVTALPNRHAGAAS